jgi:sugar phosphate isomerase/epimerase
MRRRTFLASLATAASAVAVGRAVSERPFQLKHLLASSLYGNLPLAAILPQVKKTGATAIDLWPKVHGTQREEIDALGHDRFAGMLREHGLTLGATTRFDRGPYRLGPELEVVHKLGGTIVVAGSSGKSKLTGPELKAEIASFAEKLKPHAEKAASLGITIAIENHARALLETPDSLRWFAELAPAGAGIAFAPYHLPQDAQLLASLLRDIGPKLTLFYAWAYGLGSTKPLPIEQQLQQLPGRGTLDFTPMLRALREMAYAGPTEIFMHPTPRGIPILPTAAAVSAEIDRARQHLEKLLAS